MKRALYIILMVIVCACSNGIHYYQYQHIEGDAWLKSDTLCFEAAMTDSLNPHQLEVGLRYTAKYPYQNLRVGVRVITPDSQFLPIQTLDFQITSPQGSPLGYGKGGLFQLHSTPVNLPASKPGSWKILILHQMSDSTLIGVHDVGVKIGGIE